MDRPFSPPAASNPSGDARRAVSSIPMELLRVIFGHVAEWPMTPWTERSLTLVDKNLRHVQLHLASVCAVWRNAVLHTPELWTTIYLTDGAIRDPVAYVNACINRSAQWPLHVVVNFSHTGPLLNDEVMPIWDRMLSHSFQWQRCHFTFTCDLAMTWDIWPESTPHLEELVVVFLTPEGREIPASENDYHARPLPTTPRLKRLSFDSIRSPPITLQNLEYLSIHLRKPQCTVLWDVLSQTPLLREARIFWPHSDSWLERPPRQTISLPNLQFLEMYGQPAQDFPVHVETLHLPALHTLAVSSYCSYSLEPFFRRVATQVRNLVLRYEPGSWLSSLDALSICQMRSLREIVVCGAQMDYVTGEDMTTGSDSQTFAGFFEQLRYAPEMRQLNTLKLVDCKHDSGISDPTSFEVDFLDDGKGWADPQLAPFIRR